MSQRFPDRRGYTVYIVTSTKGGIGKSTVCANLSHALSLRGKRVLCIDCDYSNRALDLLFGCEDRALYNISDILNGICAPADAAVEPRRVPGGGALYFIPGPDPGSEIPPPERLSDAVGAAAKALSCDFVMIDTPGVSGGILTSVCGSADRALITVSHGPASVRAAEKTGYLLEAEGVTNQKLVINRFDTGNGIKNGRQGIRSLIENTHIPLIGVVPDSPALERGSEAGLLSTEIRGARKTAGVAFGEIAGRICGERVPLLSFLPAGKRRRLIES